MERTILIITWIASVVMLLVFVPLQRWREAAIVFLAGQALTWAVSISFIEWNVYENQVREFVRATGANFTFNFIFYPALGVLHCLYYPRGKSIMKRVAASVLIPTVLTVILYFIRNSTQLIRYIHYTWYINWIVFFVGFLVLRKYYEWFFRLRTADAGSGKTR